MIGLNDRVIILEFESIDSIYFSSGGKGIDVRRAVCACV